MNDVTAIGGEGLQGFMIPVTLVLNIISKKCDNGGMGIKSYPKLREVIYGRPLM